MSTELHLTQWANLAAIAGFFVTLVGAVVGIYGYVRYRLNWAKKTQELVNYLKHQKHHSADGKRSQHTITHLVRYVGLTEEEILKISFENLQIRRRVGTDANGRADTLYFEYKK